MSIAMNKIKRKINFVHSTLSFITALSSINFNGQGLQDSDAFGSALRGHWNIGESIFTVVDIHVSIHRILKVKRRVWFPLWNQGASKEVSFSLLTCSGILRVS